MDELLIFAKVMLAVAGGIVTIGGAGAVVMKIYTCLHKPQIELADKVSKHGECLNNDHKRIGNLEDSNRLILRGIMQLMMHEIDGNHIDQLVETRDAMEEFLINK